MARLRSRRLVCFYCGKRSDTRFDGVTRQFTCKYCDATNHLDEDGEITDPPVATEEVAATPIASISYTDPSSRSVFCDTCLHNQRLFVASLAQYGERYGGDEVELDRDYYRYRQGLEKRYPQICKDCEAAAGDAIRKAEYTAKTDHLRKMMELSRKQARNVYRRKTPLDWLHLVTQIVWWTGLVLQMLWHLKIMSELLRQSGSGMADPDDSSVWASAAMGLRRSVAYLPANDFLIQSSITASFASAWWNPKFVQVSRGFTKQLSGFRQWYILQTLICLSRYFFKGLDLGDQPRNAQLSAHIVTAGMMVLTHTMAAGCIRTDTTPLFGPHSGTISPPRQDKPARRRKGETKSLAETLDDVLPTIGGDPGKTEASGYSNNSTYSYQFTPPTRAAATSDSADEMEWTPTVSESLPRALKNSPSAADRAFGQAPTHENSGPFYYKTPPAPANPARKLRNPPNQPALWKSSPTETENTAVFRGDDAQQAKANNRAASRQEVEFARQNFFVPRAESKEDESLASMLGKGFSLEDNLSEKKKGWFGW